MGFSKAWEETYQASRQIVRWPWSDVVSHVLRHVKPKSGLRVLELGFGTGPNIPFFLGIEADYHGIEGSASAMELTRGIYPQVAKKLVVADFTQTLHFAEKFDLILDRGSLTHNATADLRRAADLIKDRLAPDGCFLGVDWFSTMSSEFKNGQPLAEDPHTLQNIENGKVSGLGKVHFSDEAHLRDLFRDFHLIMLEQKITFCEVPKAGHRRAFWDFLVKAKS